MNPYRRSIQQQLPSGNRITNVIRNCLFSSSSLSSSSTSSSSSTLPPCDIVKGPSLLRTSVHRPRPSLLHLPALRALPFWTQKHAFDSQQRPQATKVAYQDPSLTWVVQHFEEHWETILEEYKAVAPTLPSDYQVDTEHSLHEGSWDWHSYMLKGKRQTVFELKFPKTSKLLQQVRDKGLLFEHVPFGYSFFSTLHPNSRILPHSAPMNLRIRLHLPLIVPQQSSESSFNNDKKNEEYPCGIRVGPMSRPWIPGKAMLLDDSYDHEVWNNTDTARVLLLVDIWHPDVTQQERQDVVALFDHAKREGWWSAS